MEREPRSIEISNFLRMSPQLPEYSPKNQNYLIAGANPLFYLDDNSQEQQIAPLAASIDWSQINPKVGFVDSVRNGDAPLFLLSSPNIYNRGQAFTVASTGVINRIKFALKAVGSPALTGLVVDIFLATGSAGNLIPTGSRLARSAFVSTSGLTGSYVLTDFVFTGGDAITLTAGVQYVAVIRWGDGTDTDYVDVGSDTTKTAPLNASKSTDGNTFTVDSTQDLTMYVYLGGVTGTILDGNVVHGISNIEGTYSAYIITDTTHVYGITTSSVVDLGYPSGSTVNNTAGRLAIAGGKLFAIYADIIYKNTLTATIGGWSSALGSISNPGGVHFIEPFLDFIALANAPSGSNPYQLVDKFDVVAFTKSTGIDLGKGFGIFGMTNYNDKYLAIAGARVVSGGTAGFTQNYLFLWDGISTRYNYSMRIPGKFIDMKVIDSVLYVIVQVSDSKFVLYQMARTDLKKILTIQYSTVYITPVSNTPMPLFNIENFVGIHLATTSDISDPLLVYGREEAGQHEFIHSYGRKFDLLVVGYDGHLFGTEYVLNGNSVIYYLPASGTYQQIFYKSQWIPIQNISTIDIIYETPPNAVTDAINVKIYGRGENLSIAESTIDGVPCQVAQALDSITPTNILNQKRTRLDLKGFNADEILIRLSTVNSTWKPIIRAIILIP